METERQQSYRNMRALKFKLSRHMAVSVKYNLGSTLGPPDFWKLLYDTSTYQRAVISRLPAADAVAPLLPEP